MCDATVEQVRELYEEATASDPTIPRNAYFGRGLVGVLLAEIDRLKAGDFTEDEFQNLCHKFGPDDRCRFEAGCREYQDKLFGPKEAETPA